MDKDQEIFELKERLRYMTSLFNSCQVRYFMALEEKSKSKDMIEKLRVEVERIKNLLVEVNDENDRTNGNR